MRPWMAGAAVALVGGLLVWRRSSAWASSLATGGGALTPSSLSAEQLRAYTAQPTDAARMSYLLRLKRF